MKYFIVSDVHSFYDELMMGLEEARFDFSNPHHIFVSLGDLFDRGPKACECLQFVNSLPKGRKILIRGNHENCMQEVFVRGYFKTHDLHNKTNETITQFYQNNHSGELEDDSKMINWVKNWEEYKLYQQYLVDYEIIRNNIFVHGWLPYQCRTLEDLKHTDWMDWYDAVWDNGPYYWKIKGPIKTTNKKDAEVVTVFCGHIHSYIANFRYHNSGDVEDITKLDYSPFIDEGIVNIDSCTALSGKVNVYVLEV